MLLQQKQLKKKTKSTLEMNKNLKMLKEIMMQQFRSKMIKLIELKIINSPW